MATGGCERSVDSRVVCSVCLEPYRGRQPKLLPCFHTFCLPCLSQLAHTHHQGGHVACHATGEGDQKTVTCPTCRNVVSVPPGGVKDFQSNFYVDADESPSSTDSNTQDAVDDPDLQNKIQTQVKVVETVLARLAEQEEEITRQRRALDDDIQTRYAAGLRHLADARDHSLISSRDAAQAAHDKLEADKMLAQMLHTKLTELAGNSERQKTTACKASGALLSDATFRHFRLQGQKTEAKTYFSYFTSVTPSLIDSCTQFMGTVLPFGQASDLTVGANKPFEGDHVEYMDLLSNANLRHDVTTLRAEMDKLQQSQVTNTNLIEQMQTHVSSVEADNARLLKEVNALQGNMTSVQSESSQLGSSVATVQKTLHKEIAVLQDSLAKYSHRVAFHVWLSGDGAKKQKTLILDQVETNVGGGYNPQTGIFTAPVSGTYIFMATTKPCGVDDTSFFTIIVENKTLGLSHSSGGLNSSTGHAVVEVAMGQRVWMQSYGDQYYFGGSGFTHFSGVLVQAKLQ